MSFVVASTFAEKYCYQMITMATKESPEVKVRRESLLKALAKRKK